MQAKEHGLAAWKPNIWCFVAFGTSLLPLVCQKQVTGFVLLPESAGGYPRVKAFQAINMIK